MKKKRETEHEDLLTKKGNPLHETVTYKIGGTIFEVSTICGGSEPFYSKMERLIKAETVKTPTDKEKEVRYNKDSNLFVGRSLQKELTHNNGFPNPTFFIDDGVSGVTFDRPGWNEMIRLAEAGTVKTVIVKDTLGFQNLFQIP